MDNKINDCIPVLLVYSTVPSNRVQDGIILDTIEKYHFARAMQIAVENSVSYDDPWFAGWKVIASRLLQQLEYLVRYNVFVSSPLVRCRMWLSNITTRYLSGSLFSMVVYVARLEKNERFVVRLLKAIKIAILTGIAMKVPTTAALSEFDLSKIGPSVYGQLAQGTVIACFAVLLTRAIHQQPINSLADGPLSSLSSLYWLWKNRGNKPNEESQYITVSFHTDVNSKLIIRRRLLAAIPGAAIIISSFVAYLLLSVDDRHQRNWATSVSISGIASELLRLSASWLAITATRARLFLDEVDRSMWPPMLIPLIGQSPFIYWRPHSVLRGLRPLSELTDPRNARLCFVYGTCRSSWYWKNYNAAVASLSLYCLSVSLVIFSTGALIASGDTSIAAAFLGMLLCLSACGTFRAASPKGFGVLEFTEYMSTARPVKVIIGAMGIEKNIIGQAYVDAQYIIHHELITDMASRTKNNKKIQVLKTRPEFKIDIHDIFGKCANAYPALKRIMKRKDETTGRSILLEIADSLYCRALLLIRHAHACPHSNYKLKGSKCHVDASKLMSSILLVSGHVECPEVHEILSNVKAWMNHDDLLWSIIGSHITLEMMLLPYLRRQLESPNTLDLALRICHMAMYGYTPSINILEAVPTAMYYLLTGDTAFGHATARVVECAIYAFGTVDMTLALDKVIVRFDQYVIDCQGKLHDWPGGFIPIADMSINTDQPRYCALAKATFRS
ncbi:hypothetical protein INT44_007827 [Umbelopsis vinacea]|uniref:Uncharacterized protein n=1 Tax=Umbelopsis vinacea TaxID=44442 RepID=A0A8H7PKW4_9FUNG|nr:hypothetical protein INT44_007827 [Umbelopsis vinacea]